MEEKMKSMGELVAVYKLRKWKRYWEGGTENETMVKERKTALKHWNRLLEEMHKVKYKENNALP